MLQSEWTRLISNFKNALKRRVSKSGDGGGKRMPTSEFFQELLWLQVLYSPRHTFSNVELESEPESPAFSIDSGNASETIGITTHGNASELAPLSPPMVTPMVTKRIPSTNVEKVVSTPAPGSNYSHLSGKKRKSNSEAIDILLAKALMDGDKKEVPAVSAPSPLYDDSDTLFCKSLVGQFNDLTPRDRKKVKIQIMQLMLDLDEENY